jgi:4-hydroxy-4-methyl-2-oxoglutarate aldolase
VDPLSPEYYDWIAGELYTAVLADVLDSLGARRQTMHHDIRPLYEGASIVGRAATMLAQATDRLPVAPYQLELALLDALTPGEVVVCTCQGERRSGIWGELLSTHARARGARGALIDGLSRDRRAIRAMQFPVFAAGLSPADSRGRLEVTAIRVPLRAGGVLVHDGDLVVADDDGCVVVPQTLEAAAIAQATEKVAAERTVRTLLRQGVSIEQVFKEHGVL